jgi:hypothetical protein
MRKTIEVAFATIVLALCLTKAAGAPLEGTWEGTINGQKALTLKVTNVAGHFEGSLVMYVVDKKFGDPDARIVGQAEHTLSNPRLADNVLRFSIHDPDVTFEMTPTGGNSAVLKQHHPERTFPMQRK